MKRRRNEQKIVAIEHIWATASGRNIQFILAITFDTAWKKVLKEAVNPSLQYGRRKILGYGSLVLAGYFGLASSALLVNSPKLFQYSKVRRSICSNTLDIVGICASSPIIVIELIIFARLLLPAGQRFAPLDEIER